MLLGPGLLRSSDRLMILTTLPDNVFSSVLTVAPTLESSYTGSGTTGYPVPEDTPFGNIDFRAYNIDFTNTWRDYSDGPAHAISFSRANGGFYHCGFYSYQDTVRFQFSCKSNVN